MLSVVTGATSGIGRWVALGLAQAGHDLVLIGRNAETCASTRDWLTRQAPTCQVQVELADLSMLAETRAAAARITRPVDVLVNNAGTYAARREETPEGHERVLATNHLSPFVLTQALLPRLQQAAAASGGARIVNVGSSTSERARIDPDDLEGRRRWGLTHTYAQSKLALLIASNHWARVLSGTGVVSNTVHPGAVATRLVREGGVIGLAWRAMAPFLLTEAQGARTPLHVALDLEFAAVTGSYVKARQVARQNPRALDAALAARVLAATERLTGPPAAPTTPAATLNAGSSRAPGG